MKAPRARIGTRDATRAPARVKAAQEAEPKRKPVEWLAVDLPAPISVNAIWALCKNPKTGAHFMGLSKPYKAWIEEAGYAIATQKPGRVEGHYALTVDVGRNSQCDLDNCVKAASDLLQKHGIIDNDRLSTEICLRWLPGSGMRVTVIKTKAPAPVKTPEAA